jgi:hypothetical protein
MSHRSLVRAAVVTFSIVIAASCGGSADNESGEAATAGEASTPAADPEAAELEKVRAATERFNDVNVALAEGYVPDPSGMCITAEMEGRPAADGAMGVHYLRPDLLGLAQAPGRVNGTGMHTDFMQPAILLYEPQADATLKLVGVENLVWAAAWQQAGNATPPSYQGHEFNYMIDDPATTTDEAHGFEPHYDLHVWLYRDNPSGRFVPFNPAVTCEHAAHAPAAKTGD